LFLQQGGFLGGERRKAKENIAFAGRKSSKVFLIITATDQDIAPCQRRELSLSKTSHYVVYDWQIPRYSTTGADAKACRPGRITSNSDAQQRKDIRSYKTFPSWSHPKPPKSNTF
jgi:hypothetical protein